MSVTYEEQLANSIKNIREGLEAAVNELNKARREAIALRMRAARMEKALEEIKDRAEDNYDGPEDRTHGPYLALANEGLGVWP
jgi:hypothetical protein